MVMDSELVIFFCFAITLHNLAEALWLPQWSKHASKFHRPVSSNEFNFAVVFITILAYLSTFLFFYFPEVSLTKWMFTGFLGSMIVNAIFPHLVATILMKKYAPGLMTGVLLNVPINSLIIYQMFIQNLISWKGLILSTIVVGCVLLALIPIFI